MSVFIVRFSYKRNSFVVELWKHITATESLFPPKPSVEKS